MKGKDVTLRISMMAFTQLMFIGCAGTFSSEVFKKAEINLGQALCSLAVAVMAFAYISWQFSLIFSRIKKRKKESYAFNTLDERPRNRICDVRGHVLYMGRVDLLLDRKTAQGTQKGEETPEATRRLQILTLNS
jgi:hypothetical protein